MNLTMKRYYSGISHQRIHKYATFFMFVMLAAESLIYYVEAFYYEGDLVFRIHIEPLKIASTIIYLAVAILIGMKVQYKLLLIPDFFLLCIKLYTAAESFIQLSQLDSFSLSDTGCADLLEKGTESALFSLFLIVLFTGKLTHPRQEIYEKLPFICFAALAACFPFTLFFEVIKLLNEASVTEHTTALIVFSFTRGILNEIFLDLPYAMLIILVFFIPERKRHHKINLKENNLYAEK